MRKVKTFLQGSRQAALVMHCISVQAQTLLKTMNNTNQLKAHLNYTPKPKDLLTILEK